MPEDGDKEVQPQIRPEERGADRGTGDEHDANRAGGSADRAAATTEYGANQEPGGSSEDGYVQGGEVAGRSGRVRPEERAGEG